MLSLNLLSEIICWPTDRELCEIMSLNSVIGVKYKHLFYVVVMEILNIIIISITLRKYSAD